MTEYARPLTLEEAVALRRDHPDWLVLAGGTDVMVGALERPAPPGVLDVFGLAGLDRVRVEGDELVVGAAVTYTRLLEERLVAEHVPILAACAREVGALQIQGRGTIGGNVITSSPVGDTLPVLLAHDASVELASAAGTRSVPYESFLTGYRETSLRADELLVAVRFPLPEPGTRAFWRKVGSRRAQAISKVMIAATAILDADGTIANARVALGAVADRPVRIRASEGVLAGEHPSGELAARASEAARGAITPIDDVRSTAAYRRLVSGNLVAQFVRSLAPASEPAAGT